MKRLPFKNCIAADYSKGSVTQWFGENPYLYASMGLNGHNGIDLVDAWGTDLVACDDGVICETKTDPNGYGEHVRILTSDSEWTYGHLSRIDVKIGQQVKAGDIIGAMGNTGFVVSSNYANQFWGTSPNPVNHSGTHLHFGKRPISLIPKIGYGTTIYSTGMKAYIDMNIYNNGFKGSIDFRKELEECSKQDLQNKVGNALITLINLLKDKLAKLLGK